MTLKENKSSKRKRVTLSDSFLMYPYKKKEKDALSSEGIYHFPKSEIVDDHKYSLTRKEFLQIADKIFERVLVHLKNGVDIEIPARIGTLTLKKYRPKRKSIDWHSTNTHFGEHNRKNPDDKKRIYHRNTHSNGYKVGFRWIKKGFIFKNMNMFTMKLVRDVEKDIAKYFKENPNKINNLNST